MTQVLTGPSLSQLHVTAAQETATTSNHQFKKVQQKRYQAKAQSESTDLQNQSVKSTPILFASLWINASTILNFSSLRNRRVFENPSMDQQVLQETPKSISIRHYPALTKIPFYSCRLENNRKFNRTQYRFSFNHQDLSHLLILGLLNGQRFAIKMNQSISTCWRIFTGHSSIWGFLSECQPGQVHLVTNTKERSMRRR